jgi:hypothetical protein
MLSEAILVAKGVLAALVEVARRVSNPLSFMHERRTLKPWIKHRTSVFFILSPLVQAKIDEKGKGELNVVDAGRISCGGG